MIAPFEIFSFRGFENGHLAICPEPQGADALAKVHAWTPDIVVTMTTVDEFHHTDFAAMISRTAPQWMQAAVTDFGAPQSDFSDVLRHLLTMMADDKRVLIHCKGGQGRSGMLAMRLLVEQGETPQDALIRIRNIRPHAVETKAQENWASQRTQGIAP